MTLQTEDGKPVTMSRSEERRLVAMQELPSSRKRIEALADQRDRAQARVRELEAELRVVRDLAEQLRELATRIMQAAGGSP